MNDGRNTWNRAIKPIHKIGYMDGATDGQAAVFQSSFDMGYSQGLSFGIKLGFKKGICLQSKVNHPQILLIDAQKINCQICINHSTVQDNVGNLYNNQQENNLLLISEQ